MSPCLRHASSASRANLFPGLACTSSHTSDHRRKTTARMPRRRVLRSWQKPAFSLATFSSSACLCEPSPFTTEAWWAVRAIVRLAPSEAATCKGHALPLEGSVLDGHVAGQACRQVHQSSRHAGRRKTAAGPQRAHAGRQDHRASCKDQEGIGVPGHVRRLRHKQDGRLLQDMAKAESAARVPRFAALHSPQEDAARADVFPAILGPRRPRTHGAAAHGAPRTLSRAQAVTDVGCFRR